MKLIVGLGNPGKKYQGSRHNVGFLVVEELAVKWKVEWQVDGKAKSLKALKKTEGTEKIMLVKPQTFMNESGRSVGKFMRFYKIRPENLWLVHDDLDIALGEYKVQFGRGPKVHKGVNSVERELGNGEFWRVRIGVENRDPIMRRKMPGEKYVLGKFTDEERRLIGKITKEAVEKLINLLEK